MSGIGSSVIGIDSTFKQLMDGLTFRDGVQARMDGIMFQRSEGSSFASTIFNLLKDYLKVLSDPGSVYISVHVDAKI